MKPLRPDRDFSRHVLIEETNSDGVNVPVTEGTIEGYLATTKATNAADPTAPTDTLTAELTYIGGANDIEAGTWLFQLDASVLTRTLLNTHFTSGAVVYLHFTKSNSFHAYVPLEYRDEALAATEE